MAKINNTETIKTISEELKISQITDRIPSELAEKVVPTFEVNRKFINFVRSGSVTGTSGTVYTVPAGKILYLYACGLSFDADSTNDSTAIELRVNLDGTNTARSIINIAKNSTGSRMNNIVTMPLNSPIKLKAGDVLTVTSNHTAGTIRYSYSVLGYEENAF